MLLLPSHNRKKVSYKSEDLAPVGVVAEGSSLTVYLKDGSRDVYTVRVQMTEAPEVEHVPRKT